MTYKSTSDNLNYIERVASHSTKEHRTGRIDMVPTWAREPEEYYNAMRDRWSSLAEQLLKCETELQQINEKLKTTLPIRDYQFTIERQRAEREKYNSLKNSVAEYRSIARAASEHSVASVFMELARKQLDKDVFSNLMEDTKNILGRPLVPIGKGGADLTDEQKHRLRRKESQQRKRHDYFKKQYGEVAIELRHAASHTTGSAREIDTMLRTGKLKLR